MKKKFILTAILLICLSVFAAACGTTEEETHTSHVDADQNGVCDVCGEEMQESAVPAGSTEYVFEAEWSPVIENLSGYEYSGPLVGLNMIMEDGFDKGASNGYYVTGLYGEGLQLEYTIVSDADVDDATFVVRFSAEYIDIVLTPSNYSIAVNGSNIVYSNITLDNVPSTGRVRLRDFEDFTLTTNLKLKKGENKITFTTTNTTPMVGTMYATAPLVDCFKITTSAQLSWEPAKSNTNQD